VYKDGWDIELLRIIGNAFNMSLDIKVSNQKKYLDAPPYIEIGGYATSLYALPGTHHVL
jgi:hypothetical protein